MTEVLVRSDSGLSATVHMGEHELIVDEPVSAGGLDAGPNPYDLLLAALGACTAITVRMYAQMKGWPLSAVEVRLSHDRIHAEDCANCETQEGLVDHISKGLVLHGSLDADQRARLAAIAERCPVQRTLTREIVVDQRLVS
jgi:putative redox protein